MTPRVPPIQTATLARLYLEQGHHDTARAIVRTLPDDDVEGLSRDLERATQERVNVLEQLLQRIQVRRRTPATPPGGLSATGGTAHPR